MQLKAAIFDLGNVLVFHDNALLFRRLSEVTGKNVESLATAFHGPLGNDINLGRYPGDSLRQEICRRLEVDIRPWDFFDLFSCHFTPNEPMLQAVEALVGRVKLVLLSNTNHLHAEFLLPRLPVLRRFDALVLSHEVSLIKPDPRIFEHALERASVVPHEAFFFDDVPAYVEAARKVGLGAEVFSGPHQLRRFSPSSEGR